MLTHKNITDSTERHLVAWALLLVRHYDFEEIKNDYLHYPITNNEWCTYDIKLRILIKLQYQHWPNESKEIIL